MPAPFRKACSNCVKSKRRCDLVVPHCYRCRVRKLDCRYQNVRETTSSLASDVQQVPGSGTKDNTDQGGNIDANSLGQASWNNPERGTAAGSEFQLDHNSLCLPPFPDYDLDWTDLMADIDSYRVDDLLIGATSPTRSVLAGEIYQERIIYCIKTLKSYPGEFVMKGQTAFIQRCLYGENRFPMAIQDALSICALYGQKNERNETLIFQTISDKAGQLVADNGTILPVGMSATEQLASLQALILYQIIRLFDGDIRQRADAERADATLRAWTRQLKQRIKQPESSLDSNSLLIPGTEAWRTWLYIESVRRTVIMGLSVQGLYCFLKNGWDDSHHDFQDLSFYAQTHLWDAQSEYHWRLAVKEYLPLPVTFSDWDSDVAEAKPSDMESLGMMMMVLMKGVDYCCEWAGKEYVDKFGLNMHDKE